MKKLSVKQMKTITGGGVSLYCRRQCFAALELCLANGGIDCQWEFTECIQPCYGN